MLRRSGTFLVLLALALSLTGFSSSPAMTAEESGNPWWIWIIIFLALVAFVALVIWWWMRGFAEEEEEESVSSPRVAPPAAVVEPQPAQVASGEATADQEAPAGVVETPSLEAGAPEPEADDLTRIEGIGPKISGVLNAAGITTSDSNSASL